MPFIGEISALITSVSFTITATFFTLAGKKVGSVAVNRIRLLLGFILISNVHWIFLGGPFPNSITSEQWLWLGLSGLVGLVFVDALLFQAFLWIGPRLSMLMMSLAPIIAAFIAWGFLGEILSLGQWLGIITTIIGISWVILSGDTTNFKNLKKKDYILGILFGLGGASGQAVGLVLSKKGLETGFPALSGNLIRMTTAVIAIWLYTGIRGQAKSTLTQLSLHNIAFPLILGGSIFGPLIGVSFSLFAVQNTDVGIASTLMALPPIFLLPVSYLVFNEKLVWQSFVGTILAIAGIAFLFLL